MQLLKVVKIFRRLYCGDKLVANLRASSPIWASEASLVKTREQAASAPRSRVLARLASLAQIGELARRQACGPHHANFSTISRLLRVNIFVSFQQIAFRFGHLTILKAHFPAEATDFA